MKSSFVNDPDMVGAPAAMYRAWRSALIKAKNNGVSIATWQDGKVVHIQPEDIVIPPEEEQPETKA